MIAEPRTTTIEGRRVLIVERRPPLPASLATLLSSMTGLRREPVRIAGARVACVSEQDHRLAPFASGGYRGMDGIARDLRLLMCLDCETVCVRDVSVDTLARLRPGASGPVRRDSILGWYSGARRGQRTYL